MKAKIDIFRFAGLNCDFQLLGSQPFVPGFNFVNPEPGRNDTVCDPEVQCDTVDDFHLQQAIDFVIDWKQYHTGKPLFLHLPTDAIHGMTQVPKRFEGKRAAGLHRDRRVRTEKNIARMISQYVNSPLVNFDDLSTDRLLANRDRYFGFYIVRDGGIMRIAYR